MADGHDLFDMKISNTTAVEPEFDLVRP